MEKQAAILLFLALLGTSFGVTAPKNLALRGSATQSSRLTNSDSIYSDANNAIDGNRNPRFGDGSCSHTNTQTNPWWRVDLLDTYIISSVTITNRNTHAELLNGAMIHIGTSLLDNGLRNPPAGKIPHIPAGRSLTLSWSEGKEGRYVVVVLPGPKKHLVMCEVEVYGYPTPTENAAITGKATQSTTHTGKHIYSASNAIDGNRDGVCGRGSCSHTAIQFNPWWRVDLLKTYRVISVSISNTVWVPTKLDGAEIRIGNSLDNNGINNPRCAVFHSSAGLFQTFQCNGMEGRYVTVVLPKKEYLILSEVEVKGSALD